MAVPDPLAVLNGSLFVEFAFLISGLNAFGLKAPGRKLPAISFPLSPAFFNKSSTLFTAWDLMSTAWDLRLVAALLADFATSLSFVLMPPPKSVELERTLGGPGFGN